MQVQVLLPAPYAGMANGKRIFERLKLNLFLISLADANGSSHTTVKQMGRREFKSRPASQLFAGSLMVKRPFLEIKTVKCR